MENKTAKTQLIDISKLVVNNGQIEGLPKNPRFIKDERFKKLVKSINDSPEMLEIRELIVIALGSNFLIIGGNMRFRACKELNMKQIPCKVLDPSTTVEKLREYAIKDNIAFGSDDWDLLANEWELEELKAWGLEPLESEIEQLEAAEDDFDVPENGIETDIVLGDLFEIGEHRLLCGDSTDSDAVAKLMNGKLADMVFTDPPYGVSYSARTGIRSGKVRENMQMIKNDDLSGVDLDNLIIDSLKNCIIFCKEDSPFYICNNWHCAEVFKNAFEQLGLKMDAWIIWNKDWMSVGHGHYRSNHEFIFYTARKGKFYAQKGTEADVWTLRKLSPTNKIHTTEKPVGLSARAIFNSTKKEDLTLDLFLGSGSTMVASYQLKRKCYGMELDPKYCQVIIDRMIKLDPSLKIKKNGQEYKNESKP